MKTSILFALTLISQIVFAKISIPLSDSNIFYDGVFYPEKSDTSVTFNRHLKSMISDWESGIAGEWINQWVICQTGIRIRFKTASPTIELVFKKRAGGGSIGNSPTNGFSVFVDGIEIQKSSSLNFTIQNPNPGVSKTFEVTLPNLWAVDFKGLFLNDNYKLETLQALNQPVYVAIGNSITHGTGQYVSSAKTYPFILAKKMGWNLHNIAVAGATLGWAIAKNVKGQKVDVISIKIGFNDWKYSSGTLENKKKEYKKLLDSLRHYQPNAKIYCITPLFTSDKSGAAPYSIQNFRDMVIEVVNEKQKTDNKLCLIDGDEISDASMLASGDPVHLSEYGANVLANHLAEKMQNCLATNSTTDINKESSQLEIIQIIKNQITFNSSVLEKHQLNLYTMDGKLVLSQCLEVTQIGKNTFNWNGNILKPGIYIAKLNTNSECCFFKFYLN